MKLKGEDGINSVEPTTLKKSLAIYRGRQAKVADNTLYLHHPNSQVTITGNLWQKINKNSSDDSYR